MEQAGLPVDLGLDDKGEATNVFHVVPQRHAKVLRRLMGKDGVFASFEEFASLAGDDESGTDLDKFLHAIGGKLYDTLLIFIPDLMPRWEFEGYGSEGHFERDEYVEELDRSPSSPQIQTAFETIIQVNGLKWVRKLSAFFDPKLLRAEANSALARFMAEQRSIPASGTEKTNGSTTSPSLQPESGESGPTSSGTSATTPPDSSKQEGEEQPTMASPTPVSSDS